jgi:hypothetical protein
MLIVGGTASLTAILLYLAYRAGGKPSGGS